MTTTMAGDRMDWRGKLARWANVGERGAPVAFAGRQREIDLAIRQLEAWQPGTTPGRTVVAQGAPGAGKTALLGEIARRLPERLPNAEAIYMPTPWIDDNVPNVLEELAVKMAGVPADALRTTKGSETAAGVKAVATARRAESRSVSPPTLQTWRAFSREFERVAPQMNPTLLLIDEIQRIGEGEATRDLLYNLHDQTTFPVVLVCGGLSTSAARLGEAGLSRLDEGSILRIDALTAGEAQRSLEESLGIMADDVVGGIAGHPDRWARALAPPTQGWPQHVTCHFRAAAEALLASDRLAFDDANLRDALARAEDNMRHYYDRRLEASRTQTMVVYAVHEAINARTTRRTDAMAVVDAVRPLLGRHDAEDHDATFRRAGECINQMLYAGVVAYATNVTTSPLSIPIPSMAAHIAGLLTTDQREAVRRAIGPAIAH
ncbi:MAG: ATP-binding protein [Gammaproteobacteria bacterium]|nr:ATP-binding protein [Gammaproteobacteria bacterium]